MPPSTTQRLPIGVRVPGSDEQRDALLAYIREQRGLATEMYKPASMKRRLDKRMQDAGVEGYGEYLDLLQASPEEFEPLLETLFINVTRFFRDPVSWQVLGEVLEERLEPGEAGEIRVWCAGVASGEEAYTVAILLAEILGTEAFRERVKIYATDIDDDALLQARRGVYTEKQVENVPKELRDRHLEESDGAYAFRSDLRRGLIFGRHDLLQDAPISRLDLLVCRNTLMYFNRDAQDRIMARLHFAMKDDALLLLGDAEMMLSRRHLFEPLHGTVRLFKKVQKLPLRERLALMSEVRDAGNGDKAAKEVRMRDVAFQYSPVAQILVDAGGALVLANEAARREFGVTEEHIDRPFQDVELSYRPVELRSHIDRAFETDETVRLDGVRHTGRDGETAYLDIELDPIRDNGNGTSPMAVSVSFSDVTRVHELNIELEESRNELEAAYEELQSTNEELETTNEELQSTIEELETTNEELQSTNEELETMNEELNSTNAEMVEVNQELRRQNDANARLSRQMRVVLDSVPAGIVVLDAESRVEFWNHTTEDLWGLRRDEVVGRSFFELDIGLPVQELSDEIEGALESDRGGTRVLQAHDRRGRPIECRVTTSALVDPDEAISGAILLTESTIREQD